MFDRQYLPYWATFFVTIATLVALLAMGRNFSCPCGYTFLWYAGDDSGQGSQHLFDWYSPSHLIHGFLFYGATFLLMRRFALGWRLLVSTIVEGAWEVLENTEAVINRYREFTVSGEYWGDSVLNSAVDLGAMFVGFWLALNIIMLLMPSEAILEWQSAGG